MKFWFHERIQAILPFGWHHVYGFVTMQLSGRESVNPTPLGERRPEQISATREAGAGKVSEARVERGSVSSFGILRRDKTGPFHGPWKHPALKTRLDLELRGVRVYVTRRVRTENGNSGSMRLSVILLQTVPQDFYCLCQAGEIYRAPDEPGV